MTPSEIVVAREIVAAFMEPKETIECTSGGKRSMLGWWKRQTEWSDTLKWTPWEPSDKVDSLDALREVEARLTDEQWPIYRDWLCDVGNVSSREDVSKCLIHASAEEKLMALAEVLGPEVKRWGII